jgi:CBS domain-containing protein
LRSPKQTTREGNLEHKELIMHKPLFSLTAADLMSRDLVMVPREMSLQGAARLLSRSRVSGAPVVDGAGRCVGVLSTTDFLGWVDDENPRSKPRVSKEPACNSWQIFGNDAAPTDSVSEYMTSDPVVVLPGATIGDVAQKMLDARIHRVIVVDLSGRPIGILSTTDILAAVAREAQSNGSKLATPVGYEVSFFG